MNLIAMIPGVAELKTIGVGVAAGLISVAVVISYMTLFTIPAAKREAAKIAQSEMLEKFKDSSNELASDAEKYRLNRLACRAAGRLFDFKTGDCGQE